MLKHCCEPKYELLINKCEEASIKHLKDLKAFIEVLNNIEAIYQNIND